MAESDARSRWPAWPLPLLAGLLPLVGTVVAYRLSIRAGFVPECNPFVEGCVSISRAGRQGLANIVFRALVLPAAVLQAAFWLLSPAWLRSLGAPPDRWTRALPWLGFASAVALVLYASFLGAEGEAYRWLRRHAVPLYFGLTCIAMLVVAHAAWRTRAHRAAAWLLGLCCTLPLLGLVHVLLPPALGPQARDAVENATEWWGGAIFTTFFLVLAWSWWRARVQLGLEAPR